MKTFYFKAFFLLFLIKCTFVVQAEALIQTQKTALLDEYYNFTKGTQEFDAMIALCLEITEQAEQYDVNVVGKAYVLLANAYSAQGYFNKSFIAAQAGIRLKGIDQKLALQLLVKLAQSAYIKGEYQQVHAFSEQILFLADRVDYVKYQMIALAYKAMASALLGQHQLAFENLQKSEVLLQKNAQFADHVEVLEIIASAHYYLGDYQSSVEIYAKVLKLQHDLEQVSFREKHYYHLGQAYRALGRYDDAYNAFSEAKNYAEQQNLEVWVAYAALGIGEMLIKQEEYTKAFAQLKLAESILQYQDLKVPYLNTIIALAKAAFYTERFKLSQQLLTQALVLSEHMDLDDEQIDIYALLAMLSAHNGKYQKAYENLSRYHEVTEKLNDKKLKALFESYAHGKRDAKNRRLVMKMSEASELRNSFYVKYQTQQQRVYLLTGMILSLFLGLLYTLFRLRKLKLSQAYENLEKPLNYLASPAKTKDLYQHHFKMARKYDYVLSIGYLSVVNWEELSFRFDKKVMAEVSQTIALLINEMKSEFDEAGMINDGEYLLLCPHQSIQDVQDKLNDLMEALKVRFFANLGDFSVKLEFAYNAPTVQDIDPYVFLSRLSELSQSEL